MSKTLTTKNLAVHHTNYKFFICSFFSYRILSLLSYLCSSFPSLKYSVAFHEDNLQNGSTNAAANASLNKLTSHKLFVHHETSHFQWKTSSRLQLAELCCVYLLVVDSHVAFTPDMIHGSSLSLPFLFEHASHSLLCGS